LVAMFAPVSAVSRLANLLLIYVVGTSITSSLTLDLTVQPNFPHSFGIEPR
jgi:hypothetical protein